MESAAPIVRVESLTKRFPERRTWREMLSSPRRAARATVVDGVTFDVSDGEVFGLLGQNGAGKTTIFKMLTSLILPDGGTAEVDGADVRYEPSKVRRALAPVIANERSLNWRLSALENVRLFTALQGIHSAAARREEQRVLGVVGLADTREKLVGAFSSGMRQRLLLARALIGTPRVLLLDEPTRSLDPISARDFRRFLRDVVVREQGCTVLLATHDAEEVWDLCDRVGVLERGRLLEVGRTTSLRHRVAAERYRVWIASESAESGLARARAAGFESVRRAPAAEPGWEECEFSVKGGASDAADLLARLSGEQTRVARFEQVETGLAEMIERIIAGASGGKGNA